MGIFDFRNSNSATLAAEIEREQQQADAAIKAAEDASESGQQERNEAILAGDEKAVDKLDAKLSEKVKELRRKANIHAQRLKLLKEKHAEALEREESGRLDAVAAKAESERKRGADMILREYPKHAQAIGTILQELVAIDQAIQQANSQLERHGRPMVASPNSCRTIAAVGFGSPTWAEELYRQIPLMPGAMADAPAYFTAPYTTTTILPRRKQNNDSSRL